MEWKLIIQRVKTGNRSYEIATRLFMRMGGCMGRRTSRRSIVAMWMR